eukprot:255641_1
MITKNDHDKFQYTKHQTILLRMLECVRKFVLEFELEGNTPALWAWYKNCEFSHQSKSIYNKFMQKYNLIQEYNTDKLWQFLELSNQNQIENKLNKQNSIRHKRKWSAMVLLNNELNRNLNYIKHFLSEVLDKLIENACLFQLNDNNEDKPIQKQLNELKQQLYELQQNKHNSQIDVEKRNKIQNYIENVIKKDAQFWFNNKNTKPKSNLDIKSVNIDDYKLPLFEAFMYTCFIQPDKKMFHQNTNRKYNNYNAYFYRVFMDFWRGVPEFWCYRHDILLLELVLRNGINSKLIINDIEQSVTKYKQRLNIIHNNLSTHHPWHSFKTWCHEKTNISHRLKYITCTIVNELTLQTQDRSNLFVKFSIFSSYHKHSHLDFILTHQYEWEYDQHKKPSDQIQMRNRSKSEVQKQFTGEYEDPYIIRNIKQELFESFQAFDLLKYGSVLTKFIIDKLKREAKESYYFVLGQLLYSLPDPVALQILFESISILQRMKPNELKKLCLQIRNGSIFKTRADLGIADFFEILSKRDLVQTKIWKQFSQEFEQIAFAEIAEIETDHMMFVLLTIPLLNYDGTSECLIQLAQERHRVLFLNAERIRDVIDYIYTNGYLKPEDEMHTTSLKLFETAFWHPFQFFLSGQGYQWVGGILYVEYLSLLF